jgi:trehalose-6-phosphatase
MKTLEPQLAYDSFLEQLRTASSCVLLLDYDGTLAPFNVDRSLALPYPKFRR